MRKALLFSGTLLAVFPEPLTAKSPGQAMETSRRLAICRSGPPEPRSSAAPDLRPSRTAECPYDVGTLYSRLGSLLTRGRVTGAIKAAMAFGLPAMETSYDSPRSADYTTTVSGEGGWSMRLWVRETAYPTDKGPAVFSYDRPKKQTKADLTAMDVPFRAPGSEPLHVPTMLVEPEKLDIRYDILIQLPEADQKALSCMTVRQGADMLENAGWQDVTRFSYVTDGGIAYPTFKSPNGITVQFAMRNLRDPATDAGMAATCITDITVMKPPSGVENG